MLASVNGEIWLTEAGGIVSFVTSDGRTALPYDEKRAARATRFLFTLAQLSRRITRIYVYQWTIDFSGNRFDAGLVGPDGKARPSLRVLLQHRSLLR
jgi:outer membrane receptor protein involved in Fe transport